MLANCQVGKTHPPVGTQFLGMKDALYFCFLPCWAWSWILYALTLLSLLGHLSKDIWRQLRLAGFWQVYFWLDHEISLNTHLNDWQFNMTIPHHANENMCWAFEQKGARSRVILFNAYSFSCDLLIARYGKPCNLQSKESRSQNRSYGIQF